MSTALRIGLTGGIGSGKSTVSASLAGCGAVLVDTDAISRELTAAGGAALPAIAAEFGREAIGADGALNRSHMRRLVFAQPAARHRLEAILHPMIGAETVRQALAAGERTVVFDVPLLAESGRWRHQVDKILVVDCNEATQVARVMRRSGWTQDTVERVIAQQATRVQRRAIADAVIHNEGLTLEQLDTQVQQLWQHWCASPVKQ